MPILSFVELNGKTVFLRPGLVRGMAVFLFVVLASAIPIHTARAGIITIDLSQAPNNSAKGFTSTGQYDLLEIYRVGEKGFGVAFLLPPVPLELPRGGTDVLNFNQVLNKEYPKGSGWSFTKANRDLAANSFVVTADQIHKTKFDYVGIEGPTLLNPGIAGFAVLLKNAPAANTHWVSVVSDNLSGKAGNHVDINAANNGGRSPYYDDGSAANATNFLDAPETQLPGSHYFFAATYLATGPAPTQPGAVTFYNGFDWGWVNIEFPNVNLLGLASAFDKDLTSVATLGDTLGVDVSQFISQSEVQFVDEEFHEDLASFQVPEPPPWILAGLGALVLFIAGHRRVLEQCLNSLIANL